MEGERKMKSISRHPPFYSHLPRSLMLKLIQLKLWVLPLAILEFFSDVYPATAARSTVFGIVSHSHTLRASLSGTLLEGRMS